MAYRQRAEYHTKLAPSHRLHARKVLVERDLTA